jgi:hypothetical protein
MVYKRLLRLCVGYLFVQLLPLNSYAQDKIYRYDGTVVAGKVIQITQNEIRYYKANGHDSLLHIISQFNVDSIVFSNGNTEIMSGLLQKKNAKENIPQLNTWSFDVLGFTYLSISQSYERRLKNGKAGFRFPLYIGFEGGGIAGIGTFIRGMGVYYPSEGRNYYDYNFYPNLPGYVSGGFSIATGINPKVYLFNYRYVRAFVGPEVTIGYSTATNHYYSSFLSNTGTTLVERDGTFAATAKFGLMFYPIDKLNLCVDGGAGAGCMFGSPSPLGWVGTWHIGLAIGTNF